jgi:O-antigen ligase
MMMSTAVRADWWRIAVAVSFSAAILRSGVFAEAGSALIWYALQFGPILVALVRTAFQDADRKRRIDLFIVLSMAAVVLSATLSAVTSVAPSATLAQSAILALMFSFFAITYLRRWTVATVVRGDIVLIFVLICIVQAVGLLFASFQLPFAIGDYGRFTGLLSNANYAGMLACVALPLAIYVYRIANRWIAIVGATVALIALIASGSRGALVAAGLGILVMIFFLPLRKMFVSLGILAALGGLLLIAGQLIMGGVGQAFTRERQDSDITSGRGVIYAQMIESWGRVPFTGYGYHATDDLADGLSGHNTYLSTLTETGILGAIALVALLVCIVFAGPWRTSDRLLFGAVVAVAVMEATESAAFGWGGPTALISWSLVLGFAALGRAESNREPDGRALGGRSLRVRTEN